MAAKLRQLRKEDLQAATQCGLSAWGSCIEPLLEGFGPEELTRIECAFSLFLAGTLQDETKAQDALTIAELEGEIAGFCNIEIATGHLSDLWVAPKWQGQGVAAALMKDAKSKAQTFGHTELKLEVMTGNKRAIAFYHKQGFETYAQISRYDTCLERQIDKMLMSVYLLDDETN